jgi:hypothetical protein
LLIGRKNLDRRTDADWRQAGGAFGAVVAGRSLVQSECSLCSVHIWASLQRFAEKRWMNLVLWG